MSQFLDLGIRFASQRTGRHPANRQYSARLPSSVYVAVVYVAVWDKATRNSLGFAYGAW
jgi:hypothetical protein